MRIGIVKDQIHDTVSFHAVRHVDSKSHHIKITEDGDMVATVKEKGLHIEPFLKLPKDLAVDFLRAMLDAAREYGINIPEDSNLSQISDLKTDKEWQRKIIEKLLDQ